MSRSIKQPIYKDKGYRKGDYWRAVRSTINNKVRQILSLNDPDDVVLPNAKEIINDYDYSDYSMDARPYPDELNYQLDLSPNLYEVCCFLDYFSIYKF